jgi:hypothetical protein
VLFLSDADRFLAQATNAIALGANQQSTAGEAAGDRRKLRGTSAASDGGPNAAAVRYWKVRKTKFPGTFWGKNDGFQYQAVDVTFTGHGSGFDHNDAVQGGGGAVEGTGGAIEVVARKLQVLQVARTEVQALQQQIQDALGLGAAVRNA